MGMWYNGSMKNVYTDSLHGRNPVRAFLMSKRGEDRCQGNRNGRVPIPAVRNLRTADSVRSIKGKRINGTKNMTVIRRCVKDTDERGNESVTDMLQIIRFARCA